MMDLSSSRLRAAARMWGLMTSYENTKKETVWAKKSALIKALSLLSHSEIHSNDDLDELIRRKKNERLRQAVPPVVVCTADDRITLPLTLPVSLQLDEIELTISPEEKPQESRRFQLPLPPVKRWRKADEEYYEYRLHLEEKPEVGYYRLLIAYGEGISHQSLLVVSAPLGTMKQKDWGLFTPLYALRRLSDWGIGDLGHLAFVQNYVAKNGGRWTGVLPLLAKHPETLDDDVSPYAPVSRLFWNEIYIDLDELISSSEYDEARALRQNKEVQEELHELSAGKSVDYSRCYRLKERFLKILSDDFFSRPAGREAIADFAARFPQAEPYSEYMAASGRQTKEYHLYVQFQMERQLAKLKARYGGLYLDLPLGSTAGGFDQRYYPSLFLDEFTVGAPPDAFFKDGQNWGFPPVDPEQQRRQGYHYFREVLGRHLCHAAALRIDHVMSLHRLYLIPQGESAKNGVYLRYPYHELYAVLTLEAHRHQVQVIGEDLGTVPKSVRRQMHRWGILGMWVLQLEVLEETSDIWQSISRQSISALNTHDMIPFAGYLQSKDVEAWRRLHWIDSVEARRLHEQRRREIAKIGMGREFLSAMNILDRIADKNPAALIINLEDLWDEEQAQNIPATQSEHPNWRRRHRQPMNQWMERADLKKFFTGLTKKLKG